MKYKKGDTVKIREDLENVLFDVPSLFNDMAKYAGKVAKIENIVKMNFSNWYYLDVDNQKYMWGENCFEAEFVQKKSDVKSPAEMLREIAMWVEMLNIKEFDIQCTDGVVNLNMAKNVEE